MTARDPRNTAPEGTRGTNTAPERARGTDTAPERARGTDTAPERAGGTRFPERRARDRRTEPSVAEPPGATTVTGGWRDQIVGAAGLNLIAGIWLIISPFVLGYTDADAAWNPIVFGAIVAVLALARLSMPARTAALSFVNAAIGVWLFLAGFWLQSSNQAQWNEWLLGIAVFALAMTALATPPRAGEEPMPPAAP
jgi:hypothetical protein